MGTAQKIKIEGDEFSPQEAGGRYRQAGSVGFAHGVRNDVLF